MSRGHDPERRRGAPRHVGGGTGRSRGSPAALALVAHDVARAVGDSSRPGAAQPRPLGLHPPAHRLGGAVPRVRRRGRGSSVLWLWPRTRSRFWDRLAVSAVEVGIVFTALTLVTGSIWGRPDLGVWWAWDARLTSTALLLVLLLGYMAVRRVAGRPRLAGSTQRRRGARGRGGRPHRALLGGLVAHAAPGRHRPQRQSSPTIHGSMAWTLLLGFVAFTLLFAWMLAIRYRVEVLTEHLQDSELDVALHERWAEGTGPGCRDPVGALAGRAGRRAESRPHEVHRRRLHHRLRRVPSTPCGDRCWRRRHRLERAASRRPRPGSMTEPEPVTAVLTHTRAADAGAAGRHRVAAPSPGVRRDPCGGGGGCGCVGAVLVGGVRVAARRRAWAARSTTTRPSTRRWPTGQRSAPDVPARGRGRPRHRARRTRGASTSSSRATGTRVDVVRQGNRRNSFSPTSPSCGRVTSPGASFVSSTRSSWTTRAQYIQAHPEPSQPRTARSAERGPAPLR